MTGMASTATRRAAGLVISGLLALAALTGCGGNEPSPVCSDLDAVKKSVSALTEVKLEQGVLPDLRSKVDQVQQDVAQLRTDADSEFSGELDGVDNAYVLVRTSLDEAVANPSATTVSGVGTALASLSNELQHLQAAVDKTC